LAATFGRRIGANLCILREGVIYELTKCGVYVIFLENITTEIEKK
jgi:hypothetical protein